VKVNTTKYGEELYEYNLHFCVGAYTHFCLHMWFELGVKQCSFHT